MLTETKNALNDIDVGSRLRELRKSFGYSQRELAKKAGMTHGGISQAERNNASPSIGTLRKILNVFSISFSDFFSDRPLKREQVFFSSAEFTEMGAAGVSIQMIGKDMKGRPLQFHYEHYEPGAETAKEPFSHAGYQGGMVLEGCVEATIGNEKRVLKAGEGFMFDCTIPHRFRNPGPGHCTIVSAMTPPQ